MASKTSGMMFEHLENYLLQACKPACDQGEPEDGATAPLCALISSSLLCPDREVEEGISPGIDYYTIAVRPLRAILLPNRLCVHHRSSTTAQ